MNYKSLIAATALLFALLQNMPSCWATDVCGRGGSRRDNCLIINMNGGTESGGYTPPDHGGPDSVHSSGTR